MNGFALTLKQRFDASQKWPILRANVCMRFVYIEGRTLTLLEQGW